MKIIPVILSGGSGARLWPISRSLNPKQFLNFFGEKSLFQEAVLRTKDDANFCDPIVICNQEHRFIAAQELQKIDAKAQSIILEPIGRNTAPAIAIAALRAVDLDADSLILVMPSDHIISDKNNFLDKVNKASGAAEEKYFVTFGVAPSRAETGYGYIQKGARLKNCDEIFLAKKFVEKPDFVKAHEFLQSGEYLWNSGIFLFKASAYLEELKKLHKDIFANCKKSYIGAQQDLDFIRLGDEFKNCANISIDNALMENSDRVVVAPISAGWSDVGSWQSVADFATKDQNQNSLIGDVKSIRSKNCYINSHNILTAAIGVENLIIVALSDAILVINKNDSQAVKEMFELLQKQNRKECNSYTKVLRPWGSFETIDLGDRFKVKKITVKPKSSLSLQLHNKRTEHWIVVKGKAHVTCDDKEFLLTEDQSTYIPLKAKHRLENKEEESLELIEVQTGEYLEEDDIVRFKDFYGR